MSKTTDRNPPPSDTKSDPNKKSNFFEEADRRLFKEAKTLDTNDIDKVIKDVADAMFPSSSSKRS